MSDLTDGIARTHRVALVDQNGGTTKCACGVWTPSYASEGMLDVLGRHVAEVVEAAVRERVAREIEDAAQYEGVRAQRVISMCAYVARNPR